MKPTALVLFILILAFRVQGEISYSGLINDTASEFIIDINNDEVSDLKLSWGTISQSSSGSSTRAFMPTSLTGSGFYFVCIKNPLEHKPLKSKFIVSQDLQSSDFIWSFPISWMLITKTELGKENVYSGGWHNKKNVFLGVRFKSDNLFYYGYIQLSIDQKNIVTLIDYALETTPNSWVICGSNTESSFSELSISSISPKHLEFNCSYLDARETYTLQTTTNLNMTSIWSNSETVFSETAITNLSASTSNNVTQFYRLLKE